jgi:acetolactate synthase-1/2/3 large subunit
MAPFDDCSASSAAWPQELHAKLIHIDVDTDELGCNYPPDSHPDARTVLRQLLVELERRAPKRDGTLRAWHADIERWQADWEQFTRPNFDIHAKPIRPERIVADCQAVLPPDAILACDVGVNHNWYMQFWKARRPQTMLNSWGFSGMGFGAAGVLGAKLAAPDRPAVAIVGDGSFTMVPHVLCGGRPTSPWG